MMATKDFSRNLALIVTLTALVLGPALALVMAPMPDTMAGAEVQGRDSKGTLSKVTNPRTNALRAVDWRPGTDEAFIVGNGAVYQYEAGSGDLIQLDGPESTIHYYEDIAWRPKGDYAIIVGATPSSTRTHGVISKLWHDGTQWRIMALTTSFKTRLTGIDWVPDSTYAIIVGGARSGESGDVATAMLRFSASSSEWTEVFTDSGPSGLSDVEYNPAGEYFFATGLDGRIVTYDGDDHTVMNDNKLKNTDLFSISWRDNGGRGMMGGWYSGTLKGHVATTDGNYNMVLSEVGKYINDADWAPSSDYSLFVGQSGAMWEYSGRDGLVEVDDPIDTKHYYGIDFNEAGTQALIVGADGAIHIYTSAYPNKENYPPTVNIEQPKDTMTFDYAVTVNFYSNGTHDDDLDQLDYEWVSSLDGAISSNEHFNTSSLTAGRHTVTLTVDDAHAHKASTSINITIRPPKDPPIVNLGGDQIGYVGEDLEFSGKITVRDYDIISYEWDYVGDGDFRNTTGPKGVHRYSEIGVYTTTLLVKDVRLAEGISSIIVTIFPKRNNVDELLDVQPALGSKLHTGDQINIIMNKANAQSIDFRYVTPKDKEMPWDTCKPDNVTGDLIYGIRIPKNAKSGGYDLKWRYIDHNNNKTDWYVVENAFIVKEENNDNGNGALMGYAAGGLAVAIIVIMVVVILIYLMKRSVTTIKATILFYRDGRVMYIHIHGEKGGGEGSPTSNPAYGNPGPPPTQQPGPPSPQAPPPPPDQQQPYGPQTYGGVQQQYPPQGQQHGHGLQPNQAPPYQGQSAPQAQAQPQSQPRPPPQSQAQPSSPVASLLQAAIQDMIEEIREGRLSNLTNKIEQGNNTFYIEQGMHTLLGVSFSGPEPDGLRKKMKNMLQEVEIVYGNQLRSWDGLVSDMPRLGSMIEKNIILRD